MPFPNKLRMPLLFSSPWVFFLLGVFLFYFWEYVGPAWTTAMFQGGHTELLNRLVGIQEPRPLEFYQGRAQEVLFGPLALAAGWLLFALFCVKSAEKTGARRFGVLIFLFLVITKFAVLFYPPYGDAVGGPFAEAVWLYQHSFDYGGLFQQPNYMSGGPRVYMFSLYPTYLAVFLKLTPSTTVFLVIQHLVVFALAAAITAMLRECFLRAFDPKTATLASLLFLSMPLIQSQTEAINMEIPSTFFMVWTMLALLQGKHGLACLLAVLSALVKGTGVSVCGAVGLLIFIRIFQTAGFGPKCRLLLWSLIAAGTGAAIASLKFIVKDTHVAEGLVHWAAGWPSLQKEFIFYLYLFCLAAFVIFYFLQITPDKERKVDFYIPLAMFIFAGMWFLLFLNFYAVSPRYRVALYPFLIFSVVYIVMTVLRFGPLKFFCLWLVMAAALLSSYGVYYGTEPNNDHVLLERSLEYRNDLKMTQKLVRLVEDKYNNQLVAAPFILAQALALPELGYVKKKLNVMIYGFGLKYGGIRNFRGLKNLDPYNTVFVGVKVAPLEDGFPYPVGPRDFVLETVEVGNKKATLFRGGYSIEVLWRASNPNYKIWIDQ